MKILFITAIFFFTANIISLSDYPGIDSLKQSIEKKYSKMEPVIFSQHQEGIKNCISANEKIIALTFDACGRTPEGLKLNTELIKYLISKNIPSTLFISGLWLDKNHQALTELSRNSLFEIENHGLKHKPASVKGFKGYGINGTGNIPELVEEIEINANKIEKITGKRPVFYRPGTAFFDDVAVKITYELNHIPLNFSIIPGDAVINASGEYLASVILRYARNGSIILMHINHPENNALKAMEIAIPVLLKNGYRFVRLRDYKDKLR